MSENQKHPLAQMLLPSSIALIGVSHDPTRYNGRILKYLRKHGYAGRIHLVNPRRSEIDGIPCYASLDDLPEVPDLALLLINMDHAVNMLRTCADKGIPYVIIFAAGFGESTDADSHKRQDELAQVITEIRGRTRVLGPNCNGIINYGGGFAAASSASLEVDEFIPGDIGLVAQSAGIGMATIPTLADAWGMGFRYIISTGNECDLEACDFIEYMLTDPNVRVIAAVIEGFRNGKRLVALANEAARLGKPMVILRTGRTEAGAKAAASHTAAISGNQRVFEAACRQCGVICVDDIDELMETSRLLSAVRQWPDKLTFGSLSMSGGFVTLVADAAAENDFAFPELADNTREGLRALLPTFMEPSNPIDLTAAAVGKWSAYGDCLRQLDADPSISVLLPILTVNALVEGPCQEFLNVKTETDKPLVLIWPTAHYAGPWYTKMWAAGIPVLTSTTGAFRTLRYIQDSRDALARRSGGDAVPPSLPTPPSAAALQAGDGSLGEAASKEILAEAGIPAPRHVEVRSAEAARAAGDALGYPVVLKLNASGLLHKTELGGVVVGLADAAALDDAFEAMMRRAREKAPELEAPSALVQEMVAGGIETIIGTTHDPLFGLVVMFGLGGVFTEVLEDVSLRLAPVSPAEAQAMIREIAGFRILDGYRGRVCDIDALADAIVSISALAVALEDTVDQIEVNPLFVLPEGQGVTAGDGLIILKGKTTN